MTEHENEIAELRAMAALLDYLKGSHPHGLRLTPQNLIVAAENETSAHHRVKSPLTISEMRRQTPVG